jgi:hypothetical protein
MTPDQMIAALTAALQATDANGEFSNVILLVQAQIIYSLQFASPDQLQALCAALNINTSGS